FFFQAEDGIRDWSVTGVQTCALPISSALKRHDTRAAATLTAVAIVTESVNAMLEWAFQRGRPSLWAVVTLHSYSFPSGHAMAARSEERRVGEGGRAGGAGDRAEKEM